MTDTFTIDAGAHYASAPRPDSEAASLHPISIVFGGSDSRHWTAYTELMAATDNIAVDFCNSSACPRRGRDAWWLQAEIAIHALRRPVPFHFRP